MRKQELHPRTAVINKTQKNKSKKARAEALAWLATAFPAAFDNRLRIRPLKIGIMDDILHHASQTTVEKISKSKLREAVVLFTRRLDYLACLKLREARIDLQGNPVSVVTAEEAEHAAAKIKKRVEKGARNARKMMAEKSSAQPTSSSKTFSTRSTEDFLPSYPLRAPISAPSTTTSRAATVVVKHKTSKIYDPNAVARLKEKLGISRAEEEKKEVVD